MRDRLIEVLEELDRTYDCFFIRCEQIADHLLANGVIVPPCKVGDTIYYVDTYEHAITNFIVISIGFCCLKNNYISTTIQFEDEKGHREFNYQFFDSYFGKTVFFTKEEAEEKLKERD